MNYIGLGSTILRVEASNACGTVFLQETITVTTGCPDLSNVTILPYTTVTKALFSNGTPKTPGDATTPFMFNSASGLDVGGTVNYFWYVNEVRQAPQGVQPQTTFNFATPTPNASSYSIRLGVVNECNNTDTVKSTITTVNVTRDAITDVSGNFRIDGKTCLDVVQTNWPAGNTCMPLAGRVNDFANLTHVYNFAGTGTYSNLTWSYDDPNAIVATGVPAGTGNSPGPNTYALTFTNDVRTKATGRTKSNPLTVTITAKYWSGVVEWQVTFDIDVADCSCGCIVKGNPPATRGYITFMCYNLGAAVAVQTMTPAQQQASAAANNYGSLYQWGRTTDGHQVRTSATVAGPLSGANLNANGQPAGVNVGRFVLNSINPHDWRTPQLNTLWNTGTEANPIKSVNDPCPAGWRVPTNAEWAALANTSLNTRSAWQSANTPGYFIRPNDPGSSTWTLFLPAGGFRSTGGGLTSVGSLGTYWSSAPNGADAWYLRCANGSITAPGGFRAHGFSVRCVAE